MLALEGAASSAHECATAAGRVYDKLQAHVAPLLGAAGVQALLVRSVKIVRGQFPFLEVSILEGSANLRACLEAQDPAVAAESAATLFGTFFALIAVFIGERLTTEVQRRAWPTIEASASTEKSK